MYRTCLFCHHDLGGNETIESLPIGRRLAFDQARGRLWVVCRRCERWNLTPFDERWEAIEECERAYRDARRRFATDQIGLGRAAEGLELVRIGEPLRPEFAAWRYGDQFGRRHRRHLVLGLGVTVATTGLQLASYWVSGVGLVGSLGSLLHMFQYRRRLRATIKDDDGMELHLKSSQLSNSQLDVDPDSGGAVLLVPRHVGLGAHRRDSHRITGPAAFEAVGKILPRINQEGGSRRKVAKAAALLDDIRDSTEHFRTLAARVASAKWAGQRELGQQPVEVRLALEMATHEEAERVWLAGELKVLEAEWRRAEELAAIADSLGLPNTIQEQLSRLKGRTTR